MHKLASTEFLKKMTQRLAENLAKGEVVKDHRLFITIRDSEVLERHDREALYDLLTHVASPELQNAIVQQRCHDNRVKHARLMWERGVGGTIEGCDSFEDYLETIPPFPPGLLGKNGRYPLIALLEPRMEMPVFPPYAITTPNSLELSSEDIEEYIVPEPAWIRFQDGRKYSGQGMTRMLATLGSSEIGFTLQQTLCLLVQYPSLIEVDGAETDEYGWPITHRCGQGLKVPGTLTGCFCDDKHPMCLHLSPHATEIFMRAYGHEQAKLEYWFPTRPREASSVSSDE